MHFFFQAEDGIRDYKVTGVQTCALPIFMGGNASISGGMSDIKEAFELANVLENPLETPVKIEAESTVEPTLEIGRASCRERAKSEVAGGRLQGKQRREVELDHVIDVFG